MKLALLTTVLCHLFFVNLSVAETIPPDTPSELEKVYKADAEKVVLSTATPTKDAEEFTLYKYAQFKMEEESNRRLLAILVVVAAVLSLLIMLTYLSWRQASPETMVNGSGLVLVIFATVLVMILAKADQQLTAATGILGAIAGYLFGKATKASDAEQKQDKIGT